MKSENVVRECIKKIKGDFFRQEDHLISDGWLSSFDLIELIASLEESFDISISLDELTPDQFESVNRICEIVKKYI